MQWEYQSSHVTFSSHHKELTDYLNTQGIEGWEAITIQYQPNANLGKEKYHSARVCFKRMIVVPSGDID